MTEQGRIRTCRPEDVEQIADLHAQVFWSGEAATPGLRSYYEEVLFAHPWCNDELASRVCEDSDGKVCGLVAAMPRPIVLKGEPAWMVAVHRLMVEPGAGPFVGVRLLKTLLDGPQALTLADWASDAGRKAWKRAGGHVQAQISLSWHKRLRPVQYRCRQSFESGALRPLGFLARPIARGLDSLLERGLRSASPPGRLEESELEVSAWLEAFESTTSSTLLRPVYERGPMTWVLDFLARHPTHGAFEARRLTDEEGKLVGWVLQHHKDGVVDVLQLGAVPGSLSSVLRHVIHDARARGMLSVEGRVEPRTFEALAAERCLFSAGYAWALVHSHDPATLQCVQEPETFLSSLEGERWLCSVDERI